MKYLLAIFLLVAAPVFAQWNQDGKVVQDESWRKANGNFGVMLMLTDEPQKLMDDWKKPETPRIKTTAVATREKPIAAVIFFTGCTELQGKCNAKVDFDVLRPDGSSYGSKSDASLWERSAPPARNLQLSEAYLGIRIEPQDPVGTYQVKARVRDLNANLDIDVSRTFVVEK